MPDVVLPPGKNWISISTSLPEVENTHINKLQVRGADYFELIGDCAFFVPVCLLEGLECIKRAEVLDINGTPPIFVENLPSLGYHSIESDILIEVDTG